MIREMVCENWLDVQHHLFADSWDEGLGRHRSRFAFRGLANSSYRLETTLQRMGGAFERVEMHLLRNFSKYAYEYVAATQPGLFFHQDGNSIWNWLVLARHHGLPTRLLDWTYSPYVALHFATESVHLHPTISDSIIWCVDYKKAHALLPEWLQSILQREVSDVFTIEMLHQAASDIIGFDKKAREHAHKGKLKDFVVFFEPPSLDARVVNQFALMSMMTGTQVDMEKWLTEHDDLCWKLIIPATLKWEIRDKLDQANINERILYPGLDGLCRWLRRYYGPHAN